LQIILKETLPLGAGSFISVFGQFWSILAGFCHGWNRP